MKKRVFVSLRIIAALLILCFFFVAPAQVDERFNKTRANRLIPVSAKARALHYELFIADLHTDSLLWDRNLLKRNKRGHVDLPRLMEGNVALQGFGIVTKAPYGQNIHKNSGANFDQVTGIAVVNRWSPSTWGSLTQRALYQAEKLQQIADHSDGKLTLVRSRQDASGLLASRGAAQPRVGAFLGLEGAHALAGDLNNLDKLYDAGVRLIGLAHFFDNEFAGSAHGVTKGGLTPLGRDLVRKIEAKSMIVDLAHSSPQTIRDVLAMAKRPVLVSHTGVKGTCDNQRNLSDDQIRAIAAGGGVIGIGYWETAVCGTDARAVARAIRHAVSVGGIDHVALGSDYDGAITAPFDVSQLVQVTQALMEAGFTEDEIKKIMGKTLLDFLLRNLPDQR